MKKSFVMIMIAFILLLLTSCVDLFQYVSINNGQVELSIKYVIQKAIIEMGASFSGEEIDYEDFLAEGGDVFEELGELQAEVTRINTDLEVGMEMKINGSLDELRQLAGQDEIPFVPERKGDSYYLTIPAMSSSSSAEDDMAYAFLASAKYRILVDLSGDLSMIENARFIIDDETEFDFAETSLLTSSIYGKNMMIEIPMVIPFMSEDHLVIELY